MYVFCLLFFTTPVPFSFFPIQRICFFFMFNFIDRCSLFFFFSTAGLFRINGESRLSCSQASFCAFSPLFVLCCSCLCRSSHFYCRKPVAQFSSFVFPILLTSYEFFSYPFLFAIFVFLFRLRISVFFFFFFDRLCRLAYSSALLAVWKGRERKKKKGREFLFFACPWQFFFCRSICLWCFLLALGQ